MIEQKAVKLVDYVRAGHENAVGVVTEVLNLTLKMAHEAGEEHGAKLAALYMAGGVSASELKQSHPKLCAIVDAERDSAGI